MTRNSKALWCYRWVAQFVDPLKTVRAIRTLRAYFRDWRKYKKLENAEPLELFESYPQLHDRTSTTQFDPHYFYSSGWAARRILQNKPAEHLDIGSHNLFANMLSAMIPVSFLDYRPLQATLSGLRCVAGSILELPYPDNSVSSVSCLHVAEHIGLGRYGDPLDPKGTLKAAGELKRILAPGGHIYFAIPVGRPRVCFNAHRVHSAEMIAEYFGLPMVEFSAVTDDGRLVENTSPSFVSNNEYACGLFIFTKSVHR